MYQIYIVTTQPGETTYDVNWWQTATIYQIYTKSFQDSNGDGVGDLQGIISRLNFLQDTGVTGFSLTPVYQSPQIDGGYDISNFTRIDPLFGSLEDFQELLAVAHEKSLKVILDFVPNHSSDEHVWFQDSVARIEPYTDFYVWRDGVTSGSEINPPNNWLSVFGGSAWTWNEQRHQYYLHQFHSHQPDLNFQNSKVVSEITNVLRFWLDQGVDGFRISAVAHLFEDQSFPDEPINEDADSSVLKSDYDYLQHIYTTDLNETIETVYQWRNVVDEYAAQSDGKTRILITDSTANQNIVSRYFGNGTNQGAHLPLNFAIIANLTRLSLASKYVSVFNEWFDLTLSQNQTSNWILGNHDYSRIASRFALNRADGLNMLLLLPGTAFTYMGEELALLDTEISFKDTQDPYAINAGLDRYELFTRDPARTPYQWDNSTSGGFSTNESTWLPINENYLTRNLAAQLVAERSNYHTYKAILKLRQTETIKRGTTEFLALNNDKVLAFTRELENETIYAVVINLGLSTVHVDLSGFSDLSVKKMQVCLTSSNAIINTGTVVDITTVELSANAAIILCTAETSEITTQTPSDATTSTNTTVTIIPSTTTESMSTPSNTTESTNTIVTVTPSNTTESTPSNTTESVNTTVTVIPSNTTESTPSNTTESTNTVVTVTPSNTTESTPSNTTESMNTTVTVIPSNTTESTPSNTTVTVTPSNTTESTPSNTTVTVTPSNTTESTPSNTTVTVTPSNTTESTPSNTTVTVIPSNTTESMPSNTTESTNTTVTVTPSNTTELISTPEDTTHTTNMATTDLPSGTTEPPTEQEAEPEPEPEPNTEPSKASAAYISSVLIVTLWTISLNV